MAKYTFIDLFAGCGGLSEGFLSTGKYEGLAHVEWDMPMVNTLRNRLEEHWEHTPEDARRRVVCFDVQKTEELMHGNWSDETKDLYLAKNSQFIAENGIDGLIPTEDENGKKTVDLIIGGPPCQAYSIAGRAQSPTGMKDDYRNYLFESFVKIVKEYQPKVFVFENVPGLLSACPGDKPVRERIYEAFKSIGYDIRTPETLKTAVYSADQFEVPQKRNRIIIIGVKHDSDFNLDELYQSLDNHKMKGDPLTVEWAIKDMPKLYPLITPIKEGRANVSHEQEGGKKIDRHIPRYHSLREQKVFKSWVEKNMNKMPLQEKLEYYTQITGKTSKHAKYRSLEWKKPSPTVVAHLNKDGYMFIHPDAEQARSITMREAARLQTFPDDYKFVASNPYCFKMIGNAVPVKFAQGIAEAVYDVLIKKE